MVSLVIPESVRLRRPGALLGEAVLLVPLCIVKRLVEAASLSGRSVGLGTAWEGAAVSKPSFLT